jgi:hypothetical protein
MRRPTTEIDPRQRTCHQLGYSLNANDSHYTDSMNCPTAFPVAALEARPARNAT